MSQKFRFWVSVTFYFGHGADIVRMENDLPWGSGFLRRLSLDLKMQMPEAECFSPRNLYYMRDFFKLYAIEAFLHQVGAQLNGSPATAQQIVAQIVQQGAEQLGGIDSEHSFLQLFERIRVDNLADEAR